MNISNKFDLSSRAAERAETISDQTRYDAVGCNTAGYDAAKKELRLKMKALRAQLTKEQQSEAAAACLAALRQLSEFQKAEWIYSYISYNHELPTDGMIEWCLGQGKRVAVPKVNGKEMDFYEIRSLSDCVPGAYGILEPSDEVTGKISGEDKKVSASGFMLVPGLAFDKKGNRLGYGGGFYDRYLSKREDIVPAVIGYDFQLTGEVPALPHDRKMNYLIMPSACYAVIPPEVSGDSGTVKTVRI